MDTINNVKNIFLSASVPLEERNPIFFKSVDIIAIRDAVIALAATVLTSKEYHLIWGGHPSITPLITSVLERYDLKMSDRVTLYQSKEYENMFPLENKDVGNIVITEKKENKDASILFMRQKMIKDHTYEAGVFIGGMEGVLEEYCLFKESHPGVKLLPIASTGGAAKILYDKHPKNFDKRLQTELSYTSLFKELLKS